MKSLNTARRAALFFGAFGLASCDVAEFVSNPMPRFEQTWNVPAPSMSVSVASLLPQDNSVVILPDSSAFDVTVDDASVSRRVGDDCGAPCESLNGTTAVKPAFILNTGTTSNLPADVVSAAVLDGSVRVRLTNNMSFDPIFVRNSPPTQPQGVMTIVVRSGSLVLGTDQVDGATTTFAAGTQLIRDIPLETGNIVGVITVDVTINSPAGDHPEFIDANGTLNVLVEVPSLQVATVGINVPGRALDSDADTLDLGDFGFGEVVNGSLSMTITNPFAVTGTIGMRFGYGPQPTDVIEKIVPFPSGAAQTVNIALTAAELDVLLGNEVELGITGTVSSAAPIVVTPRQVIQLDNRIALTIRTGGEN